MRGEGINKSTTGPSGCRWDCTRRLSADGSFPEVGAGGCFRLLLVIRTAFFSSLRGLCLCGVALIC